MSDEEFLTDIKLNYLLLKIELYPLQVVSWCQSACSGTLLGNNTMKVRTTVQPQRFQDWEGSIRVTRREAVLEILFLLEVF